MKKTSTIFIITYLLLILTACSFEELTGSPDGDSQTQAEQAAEPSGNAQNAQNAQNKAAAMQSMQSKAMVEVDMSEVSENVVEQKPVVILFAGDMNFDKHYANMNALMGRGGEIAEAFDEEIMTAFREADIAMINNEFPYSDRGSPTQGKKFTFRADPSTVRYLNDMGVDIVGVANNHAYDYGPDALLDTLDTLSGANIKYVGAGRNIEEAMTPEYFEAGGMKIAFTAATQIERSLPPDTKEATETEPGVLRTLDPEKYVEVIKEADANADFTIVFVHWGSENVFDYEAAQKELAEKYVEAGADLIIGAHPHVLQGFEYIEEVPVIYSMGNFWFNSKTLDSCLIEATLYEGKLESIRFRPCIQKGCYTSLQHEGDGEFERIIEDQRGRSAENVSISSNGVITKTDSLHNNP